MNFQHRADPEARVQTKPPALATAWAEFEPKPGRRTWLGRLRDWMFGRRRSKIYVAIRS